MTIRSADVSNSILAARIDKLGEDGRIPKDVVGIIKDNANESAKEAINQVAYRNDIGFYRGVLIILGFAVIVATLGGLYLSYNGKDIPQFIVAIGTTALGAVAGLLAPSPAQGGN